MLQWLYYVRLEDLLENYVFQKVYNVFKSLRLLRMYKYKGIGND